jgi:hypothetical protein
LSATPSLKSRFASVDMLNPRLRNPRLLTRISPRHGHLTAEVCPWAHITLDLSRWRLSFRCW